MATPLTELLQDELNDSLAALRAQQGGRQGGRPRWTSAPRSLTVVGRGTRAGNGAARGAARRSRDRPGLGPPDLCQIVRTLKGKHQVRRQPRVAACAPRNHADTLCAGSRGWDTQMTYHYVVGKIIGSAADAVAYMNSVIQETGSQAVRAGSARSRHKHEHNADGSECLKPFGRRFSRRRPHR